MNICVFGAANNCIDAIYLQTAEALGEELARRGHTLVFGGGKNGVMGGTARGASRLGGHIIGVAPEFFRPDGVLYEDCAEFIYTGDMRTRKAALEDHADAFIVAPGGVGTYDELFEVLTLIKLGQMHKPVVLYNVNGYYDPLMALLEHTHHEGFLTESADTLLYATDNLTEVMDFLEHSVE